MFTVLYTENNAQLSVITKKYNSEKIRTRLECVSFVIESDFVINGRYKWSLALHKIFFLSGLRSNEFNIYKGQFIRLCILLYVTFKMNNI